MSDPIDPADYVEIQNLYATYNQSSDAGDADAYARCFTEDGVLDATRYLKGRQALADYKRAEAEPRKHLYRRHWNGSLHLCRNGDGTVTGVCYFLAFNGVPGSLPAMTHCGVYTDTIVKQDGRWLFSVRKLRHDAA